ncbi:MAG: PepSY domain-containing protein, partial [Acidobacteria bacterium]|nr:PepSY domain-containing protein [Acidobacteriota bacterium]
MNRQKAQKISRKWHRALAPLIGIQLFFWTLGGIYFSWFNLDDVHGDYERTEPAEPDLGGAGGLLPIETFLAQSELARIESIRVGTFMNRIVLRRYQDADRVEMYDARTGERLSPINESQARAVAEADFAPEAAITGVELIGEKGGEYKNAVPAWRVGFGNWKRTHVYVHANTGLVTARRNRIWRGFDFLWMLHILDFKER